MGKRKWVHPTGYRVAGKWHNLRLYGVWRGMITRCYNPNHIEYSYYGGSGITVCDSWKSWDNFYEWAMANGYREDLSVKVQSLDREISTGNYEPSNCRWVTMKTQQRNRRDNVYIEGKTLSQIAEESGIAISTVSKRYRSGKCTIKELTKPVKRG